MRIVFIWAFILISANSFSQQFRSGSHQREIDRITQIKIAKLTNDMRMNKTQAQKFWPIYNEFDNQRKEIRREIRNLSKNLSEDDDIYKKQQKVLDLKQQELDLTRRYKYSFLKVISEEQYGTMLASEERFNQALLERLKKRNRNEE